MGAANGTVLGITKIYDSGLPSEKWNLVIVAEGYMATEQAQFQQDAQELVDHLFETAPFDEDEVACAINIYRLEVASDESGADDPDCDGAGPGTTADTYFDATYCADGVIRRLLSGDGALVQDTVEDVFPQWHQIVVLVNSSVRGGAGGSIAWLSTGGFDWRDVFIHELGHSAFGLADEYDCYTCTADEEGQDNYTGGEPLEPNVTAEPDPALVKWNAFVTAGPAVPTHDNPDCGERNSGPSPVPAGTVGTFEGAYYNHCDAYRPQYDCKMRASATPDFCVVCEDVIREFYAPFALPGVSGAVSLNTPNVVFNDVPESVTTQRAASFSVDSCVPVTFEVTALPAAPFELVGPPVIVAYPSGGTPWTAYVWFRYTCDTPGTSHIDAATIRCIETGEDFNVMLTGNCITRPTVAVQLVFDQSGSMLDSTDEGRTKEQVLKDAALAFTDILYDDNGVGLNAYDHDPHPILGVQQAGAPGDGLGRDDVIGAIASFAANPGGFTAIGDGIELAKSQLDMAGAYDTKAMIVLTDGIETASKYVSDVAGSVISEKVFAIGLGTSSQIQPATLNALTNGTGGYLLMTGNLGADDTFLLSKYYLQILAGVNNNDIILDPEGYVRPGAPVKIPFQVIDSDIEITGVVLSEAPYALRFALQTPDGTLIDSSVAGVNPTVEYRSATQSVFIRASLPQVLAGSASHAGQWHLVIGIDDKYYRKYLSQVKESSGSYTTAVTHGLKYSANVYTYSNLRLHGQVFQDSFEPGATLTLQARLTEYGVPFEGVASVKAEMTRPDNTKSTIWLLEVETGVFESDVVAMQEGVYRFRIVADGRTSREELFTRELLVTAPIWRGGDNPNPSQDSSDDPNEALCRLISCLLDSGAITPEGEKRLQGYGIDLRRLRKCLCDPRGNVAIPGISGRLADQLTAVSSRLLQLANFAGQQEDKLT